MAEDNKTVIVIAVCLLWWATVPVATINSISFQDANSLDKLITLSPRLRLYGILICWEHDIKGLRKVIFYRKGLYTWVA